MSGRYSPFVAKERRRRIVRALVAVGVLVVLLLAVALLWPRPQRGALSVATASASVDPVGVLRGVLEASRSGDHACYAITSRGTTAVLRFPEGWTADERLGLRDTSGGVVAQPDATATMLGAPGSIGTVAGCPQRGRIWTITSVDLRANA